MKAKFWLARVTVEATSPIAVGTGSGDALRDALFAVGPGGLPYLPATSLAGVLRRAATPEQDKRQQWFGKVLNGAVLSRVVVSDGLLHDRSNRPQRLEALPGDDSVLGFAAAGITRDHVRLNAAGVADGAGKFDDSAVPAGVRFTFEVRVDLDGSADGDECVQALRTVLAAPLYVGGKTNNGYGALKPVAVSVRTFDLAGSPADRKVWAELPRDLAMPAKLDGLGFRSEPLASNTKQAKAAPGGQFVTLSLTAQDHLLLGGGSWLPDQAAAAVGTSGVKQPYTELGISWTGSAGEVSAKPQAVIPASGVKGALRHRTVFHLRRLLAKAGGENPDSRVEEAIESLFGSVKGEKNDESSGRPGRVRIGDFRFTPAAMADEKLALATHVSIDRFTGGPMPGLLFSDVSLFRRGFTLQVEALPALNQSKLARQAFVWALRDLVEGRLALGTGRNAGYGFLKGNLNDLQPLAQWVKGEAE